MSSSSSDSTVSSRWCGRGCPEGSVPRLNRSGSSTSIISVSLAQHIGAQRSISAASGWT